MSFWQKLKSMFKKAPPKQAIAQTGIDFLKNITPGSSLWYITGWDHAEISKDMFSEAISAAKTMIDHKEEYLRIEQASSVPWQLVACLHKMEADLDFKCCLHNGDRIIGTGKLTEHVPAGRGPFPTFYFSALDALSYDGFFGKQDWNIINMLERSERYNGLGYLKYHPSFPSPYLWAGTNVYKGGLYQTDGHFNPEARSKRPGIVVLLKALQSLGEFKV